MLALSTCFAYPEKCKSCLIHQAVNTDKFKYISCNFCMYDSEYGHGTKWISAKKYINKVNKKNKL